MGMMTPQAKCLIRVNNTNSGTATRRAVKHRARKTSRRIAKQEIAEQLSESTLDLCSSCGLPVTLEDEHSVPMGENKCWICWYGPIEEDTYYQDYLDRGHYDDLMYEVLQEFNWLDEDEPEGYDNYVRRHEAFGTTVDGTGHSAGSSVCGCVGCETRREEDAAADALE